MPSIHALGTRLGVAAPLGLALILATAGDVAAQIYPGNYVTQVKTTVVGGGLRRAVTVMCPSGHRMVTGGGYWHRSGENGNSSLQAFLLSSAPTSNGRGWYVTGWNASSETLELTSVLQCLAETSVGSYSIVSRDVTVDPGRSGNADVKCGSGKVALAGGAVWHKPGAKPKANLDAYLTTSTPDNLLKGWTAAGRNYSLTSLRLLATAFCIPPSRIVGYEIASVIGYINRDQTFNVYEQCPAGKYAIGGGVAWGFAEDPFTDTRNPIVSSSITGDGTSWYAAGQFNDLREHPTNRMAYTVTAVCLPA